MQICGLSRHIDILQFTQLGCYYNFVIVGKLWHLKQGIGVKPKDLTKFVMLSPCSSLPVYYQNFQRNGLKGFYNEKLFKISLGKHLFDSVNI